ncbi:uncharacterized protein N7496_003994 [Penicillium cataractarum]|uniref:Subtelomeric hrmA-associated cluster protein AFUB-079030/YDR124W-like helical bundle domain-containing protein n=1 Tax=Penicillium cataractarum TaxID=2100454 RepID=A0A9W9VJD0_9EURO|nr:uncharacterized protein N7496_003994 [Penicillium cataractarum]KAJ5381566.1 hypothetical protein N7496_003994 [Penicillium cataractarum]
MVYSKPNTSTGAMKRSASALHEGAPGWDVAPPMMTPARPASFRMPYAHYALIYLDNEGKLKVDESASIKEQKSTIFTPEVRQNFLEILGERIGFQQPLRRTLDASPRRVRRRRVNAPGSDDRLADAGSDSDDCSPNGSNEMIPLRIGDTPKVLAYYEGALKHFQQLNCRMVAKAFIKFIEPRKQVRHPYNGGKPPAGSAPGTTGDPEKTKPLWWPPGVMHKEPDHLRKEYRIELLLHIIRKLGDHGITADKLKEVAGDTKRSLKHASHVDIIYEILRVRKMEERFERGEVDASMVVYVMNRGPSPKGDDEEESNDTATLPVPTMEAPEHIEEGLLTPTSSIEHVTAPLTTPIDPLSMAPTRSLPTNFSLSQPLTFDGPRQDRPYYTTPPQYTDSFSQPMLSTPVTAEMISPHDVSVFDYSTSHGFPASTSDQKFDAWAPTFRQTLFSPVDYNAPAVTHGLPQPPLHYMPMASPAQLHDMSPPTPSHHWIQ